MKLFKINWQTLKESYWDIFTNQILNIKEP